MSLLQLAQVVSLSPNYFSKLIFDVVACVFPAGFSRSFKEFVKYTLRHNQNIQIPL